LKFVGGVSVVLVLLTLAFLASNGIIWWTFDEWYWFRIGK
jgi:hypothetical protein